MLPKLLLGAVVVFPVSVQLGCSNGVSPSTAHAESTSLRIRAPLVWMDRDEPNPATLEFRRLLEERYGVGYAWGLERAPNVDVELNNSRVTSELEKRYGPGVIEKLRTESEALAAARK